MFDDDKVVMMIHLLHNLLLHDVHTHGDQGHAEDAVLEPVERLDGGVVAEADGGESDKAEVRSTAVLDNLFKNITQILISIYVSRYGYQYFKIKIYLVVSIDISK